MPFSQTADRRRSSPVAIIAVVLACAAFGGEVVGDIGMKNSPMRTLPGPGAPATGQAAVAAQETPAAQV